MGHGVAEDRQAECPCREKDEIEQEGYSVTEPAGAIDNGCQDEFDEADY